MKPQPSILITGQNCHDHQDLIVLLGNCDLDVKLEPDAEHSADHINGSRPAVIVLDTNMPPPGGNNLVATLSRASTYGVIVLCTKADATDCILGLELGADDVVDRHRDPREIAARIRRLMVRGQTLLSVTQGQSDIVFSDWRLSVERRELLDARGNRVHLTRGEFDLLAALACHQGKVMSRDQLLDHISHREWASSDRTVDVLVNRLRHKIGDSPREPRHLVTVHGVGYAFSF
ncbi:MULTISPECIES: winged helix-turn-helix domain-containing protein [Halomonas]|uniref:Winged helix-turn-helix domain-containing protein n=1 Tax=Halomonas tibetensis TaxID=2259590 RepID=A0ABV7B2L0_9GAMM